MTRHRLLVLAVMLCAPSAYAQSTSAQAEALFRQGRDLLAAGKIAAACNAFAASQKLEPAVTTLLNLGDCRAKNKQLATAWGVFLDAERQTRNGTDPNTQKLHQVALDHAKKLEPRVPKLTVTVAPESRIDRLEVFRDATPVDPATWNLALPVDGGTYRITARAPGMTTWTGSITVGPEGDAKTVAIPKLLPVGYQPPTTTTPTPTPTPTPAPISAGANTGPTDTGGSSKVPLVLGGVAAATLVGAVAFELAGQSNYADAKNELTDQARRDSLYDSANTKRYVAEGLAVAAVGCAGAAIWIYLHGRHARTMNEVGTSALRIQPIAGRHASGLAIAGSF